MYILSDPPPSLGGNTELTVSRKIDKRALWEIGGGMSKVARQADREIRVQAEGEHYQESCAIEREKKKPAIICHIEGNKCSWRH